MKSPAASHWQQWGRQHSGELLAFTLFHGAPEEMIPHAFDDLLSIPMSQWAAPAHTLSSCWNSYNCSPLSNCPSCSCQCHSPENLSALHVLVYNIRAHVSTTAGHLPFSEPTTKSNPSLVYAAPVAKNKEPSHLSFENQPQGASQTPQTPRNLPWSPSQR